VLQSPLSHIIHMLLAGGMVTGVAWLAPDRMHTSFGLLRSARVPLPLLGLVNAQTGASGFQVDLHRCHPATATRSNPLTGLVAHSRQELEAPAA